MCQSSIPGYSVFLLLFVFNYILFYLIEIIMISYIYFLFPDLFSLGLTFSSTTSMVRSNSMSANAFTQPFTNRGRNGSVSLDERQRAALSMGVVE